MGIFISPEISNLAFHLRQQGDKTSGLTHSVSPRRFARDLRATRSNCLGPAFEILLEPNRAASEDHGRRPAGRACSWSSSAILATWLDQVSVGSDFFDRAEDRVDWEVKR
jgi:hypothetical protein